MIDLAHDLGLDVVAEGVENTELWDALAELDCDVAQGYGIAAPMAYPGTAWVAVELERGAGRPAFAARATRLGPRSDAD